MQRRPCAFDQNRTCQWIASLGDAAIAVRLTGLVLARDQPEVGRDLASVLEAVGIVDARNEDLGGTRSNAGDGSDTLDTWIIFADGFKLFDDDLQLRGSGIELREFIIEFAFPEFVRFAIGNWFAE